MRWLKRALLALREAVWPERTICLCCQRPSRGGRLCEDCGEKLAALRILDAEEDGCGRRGVVSMRSVWSYQDQSRILVHALKYNGVAEAGRLMGEGMAEVALSLSLPPDTVVTWPTMPKRRRLERGIDHGRLLAETVGCCLGLPVRELLVRSNTIAKGTQRGKSRAERLTRLRGAFSCEEELNGPVLLVDDVLTTSATAMVCARCLLDAGASEVAVLTAGKVQRKTGKRAGKGRMVA